MLERFTRDARQLVQSARQHAERLHHNYVGCEHLLLAITEQPTATASQFDGAGATWSRIEAEIETVIGRGRADSDDKLALAALGIDLDAVRKAVEANFGPGSLDTIERRRARGRRRWLRWWRGDCQPTGRPRFTPRAKRCLELSLREALRLKHAHIGVDHIALALLSRDDTMAWAILVRLGVDPTNLRRTILDSLRRSA